MDLLVEVLRLSLVDKAGVLQVLHILLGLGRIGELARLQLLREELLLQLIAGGNRAVLRRLVSLLLLVVEIQHRAAVGIRPLLDALVGKALA